MTLADDVLRARRRAGLSQRELADRAGVPQSTVARIERGVIDPRWSTVVRIIDACDEELVVTPRPGKGVDRTVIRELLKLTPRQRIEDMVAASNALAPLSGVLRGRR
jgi:predicted transcriptional regulator